MRYQKTIIALLVIAIGLIIYDHYSQVKINNCFKHMLKGDKEAHDKCMEALR